MTRPKLTKPLTAWLLFTAAILAGGLLYWTWPLIEHIVMHPSSLIILVTLAIFWFDVMTGRPLPFLAIDKELGYLSSSLASTLREMVIPLLVLGVGGYGVYRLCWVGDMHGLVFLGVVWLADLVIAWSVRSHRAWLARRRYQRILPAAPVMLDTDTTDPEGTR